MQITSFCDVDLPQNDITIADIPPRYLKICITLLLYGLVDLLGHCNKLQLKSKCI